MTRAITSPEGVHDPVGMYSHLARTEPAEILYLGGQVALDHDGNLLGKGDVGAQTVETFRNIERILESAGASPANIVQLTTYLIDAAHIPAYREARAPLFERLFPDGACPPNTLLVISGLQDPEMLIEVTAVAVVPQDAE